MDYASKAKTILPADIYDFIEGGAGRELTIARNRKALDEIAIKPIIPQASSLVDISTTLLDYNYSCPILLAPTAYHQLASKNGEIDTVNAAACAGINMIVSTLSSCSIKDIKEKTALPLWFQVYIYRDTAITKTLINIAEELQYKAIVLTLDLPIMAKRYRDLVNRFSLPKHILPKNIISLLNDEQKTSTLNVLEYTNQNFKPDLSWKDFEWIKSITKLPVIVKGILNDQDASYAYKNGAAGIIVSNHGGRQLDSSISPIEVLPSIVKKIDFKIPILIDGGFQSGNDMLKAFLLGADAVLIGRPIYWGLAVDQARGLFNLIELLKSELLEALILSGYRTMNNLKKARLSN